MDRTPSSSLRNLRRGLAAGGVALLGALLPLPALAQVPFLDSFLPQADQTDAEPADADWEDGDEAVVNPSVDPTQLVGSLTAQATQLLGQVAPAATPAAGITSAAPLLGAAAPVAAPMLAAPLLGAVAPAAAPAAPTLDPMAILSAAQGLDPSALAPFMSSVPADLGALPQSFQQQIVAVLQQAQQQSAGVAHRYTPGTAAHDRRQESLQARTASRLRSIVARAHRAMAATARRDEARQARRSQRVARPAARTASLEQGFGQLLTLAGL